MTRMPEITPDTTAAGLWDGLYGRVRGHGPGRPGRTFAMFAAALPPGRALELGCGPGDDALWLASRGWQVLGADVSAVALELAQGNAAAAGLAENVRFERHDLAQTLPEGRFDLVAASFLHSPLDWPRETMLARAAGQVTPGGHLLLVEHGSRAPWSWVAEGTRYPTAEETLAALGLAPADWTRLCVCSLEREAKGPDGMTTDVLDNVIFLRRAS